MDIKARIEAAQARIEKGKQAKTRAETQKETLEKQQAEIITKMEAEGVKPETIGAEIDRLNKTVLEGLDEVEKLVPEVPSHANNA